MRYLNKTILLISFVSLCNDFSNELIYPILPLYLASLGAAPLVVGVIESFAEGLSTLLKLISGQWSDALNKRRPFVLLGYGLSLLGRILYLCSFGIIGVALGRSADRIGKGLRQPARDALLDNATTEEYRGSVFGFHRSADTLGAVLGPLLAWILLKYYSLDFQQIFLIAFIPALLGWISIFWINEKKSNTPKKETSFSFKESIRFFSSSNKAYKQILLLFILFSLINSSDFFIMMRLKDLGYSLTDVVGFYILFNIALCLLAWPIGKLSDKTNKWHLLSLGLCFYGITYFVLGWNFHWWILIVGMVSYGAYYACTDGISKTLILENVDRKDKGKALGLLAMCQSAVVLLSSALTGFFWNKIGSSYTFLGIGVIAFVLVLFSLWLFKPNQHS